MSNFATPHSEGPVNNNPEQQSDVESSHDAPSQFMVDNRPEAVAQRRLQASLDSRPQVQQQRSLQSSAGRSSVQLRSAAPPSLSFGEAKGALQRACDGRGQDDACLTGPLQQSQDPAQLKADPEVAQLLSAEFSAPPVQRSADSATEASPDYSFLF